MTEEIDLPEIDMNEISMIQGSEREQRMEDMLQKILDKLESIEKQMLREIRGKI